MYKDFNSNIAYLFTFPVSNLSINIEENGFDCDIGVNVDLESLLHKEVNKKNIFDDIYNIGNIINKEFRDIVFKPQLFFQNLVSINNLKNDDMLFFTIHPEEILTSEKVIIAITRFFKKYGISKSNTKLDTIRNNLVTIFDTKTNHSINKDNVTISTKINIIPFINTCLLIYYIKRFTYAINKGEPSTIFNLLSVFPELETFGIKANDKNSYNSSTRKNIIQYVNKLLFKLNPYLNKNFIMNYQRAIYPNLENINEGCIYDNKDIQWAFNITEYCIITPILAAYDYLLQSLRGNNNLDYYCDNCGTILHTKDQLCYDCKIDFYRQVIKDYETSKKEKANKLRKELNQFIKDSETCLIPWKTTLIDQIYINRKKSKKNYKKNKDNFI